MTVHRPWLKNYPVRWNLEYPEVPLYQYLKQNIKNPEASALVFYGAEITYRQLLDRIDRIATAMAERGIKKGSRVALMMPNCPCYVYTYYAAMQRGATVVQVNPAYTSRELEFILKDSGAKHLFVADAVYDTVKGISDEVDMQEVIVIRLKNNEVNGKVTWFDDLLRNYRPAPPYVAISPREDVAVFQYTGGTTGFPKAAMLTHFNLVANIVQGMENLSSWRRTKTEQQYALAVIPLFHSFGMTKSMNTGLVMGDAVILFQQFDPQEILNAIKKYRPSLFPGVPAMFAVLTNMPDVEKYGLDCLEVCHSGGAPTPAEVKAAFEQKTGAIILGGYGLSEASPTTHADHLFGIRKQGSSGVPFSDTDCRIVDLETGTQDVPPGEEGELIIRGPQVMSGYWNRWKETAETLRDGWLYTGDIAKMDEDGHLFITDRKKDLIISGGYNVYPREVDEVLYEHQSVLHAAAIGIPHSEYGESVKAFVVLKEGHTATKEEIIDFCKAKLARYKCPRDVEFKTSLPMTNTGKILRRVLKEQELEKR